MKKNVVIIGAIVIIAVIIGAGYYSYKKKLDAPPAATEYASSEERLAEIKRLEGLKGKGLAWQDTFRLGVLYMHAGRLPEAKATLEEAAKRRPKFDKTHESLGMISYRAGDFAGAISHWKEALALNPKGEHLTDMIEKAEMRRAMGERLSVLEDSRSKKKLNSAGEKFELAAIYIGFNRLDEATAVLNEILAVKKDLPSVYDALAEIYARKGDFAKAISYEKQALKLAPKDEGLKNRLAEMERILSAQKKGGPAHKAAAK